MNTYCQKCGEEERHCKCSPFTSNPEPQPDQSSRLLTEKEIWVMEVTNNIGRSASRDEVLNIAKAVARAQRDLSYPIGFTDGYAKAKEESDNA